MSDVVSSICPACTSSSVRLCRYCVACFKRPPCLQVNDQIIEVDGKSLVGVTQAYAASVLRNAAGHVHFLIGRETDPENSEVRHGPAAAAAAAGI